MKLVLSRSRRTIGGSLIALCALAAVGSGEVAMKTESWPNSDPGFDAFSQRIVNGMGRNLLARKGVALHHDRQTSGLTYMTDGEAGERAGEGRVTISGQPSVIAFYLGKPKPVREVGVFTFNGDARANQDFEVRFALNSKNPGKKPAFPEKPHLTTGPAILGKNGGGFHTWFADSGGAPLVPEKVDWVEFRIWRTYNVQAGKPAKTKTPSSWSALIELEVYGDPDDVVLPSKEELARRAALRKLPKQPPYEKKATWHETMVAAREAMLSWECTLDRMTLSESVATLGPWRVLGPLPAKSPLVGTIDRSRKLDLAKPLKAKDGAAFSWRELPELRDGELSDLAPRLGAKPGQVVYLCRPLAIARALDRRNPLAIGVGIGTGTVTLLPHRRGLRDARPDAEAVPNQKTWPLTVGPGQYQILARLPVAPDGSCRFWFTPQSPASRPGAGNTSARISRRERLFDQLKKDFPDPVSVAQMGWERDDSIWIPFIRHQMARIEKLLADWLPGKPTFLVERYNAAVEKRLGDVDDDLPLAPRPVRERAQAWLATFRQAPAPTAVAAARARYYALASVQETLAEAHRIESIRLAVEDQRDTFTDRYPRATEYLAQVAALEKRVQDIWARMRAGSGDALAAVLALRGDVEKAGREILLANPLLGFEKLLLARGGPGFASNWSGANRLGNELVVLSPVKPDGEITTLHQIPSGSISNFDLSFDAKTILYSNGRHVFEINADGSNPRQITNQTDPHVHHFDPCYMPDGNIMFVSTACEQAVPCTGQWYVGNMHLMKPDGSGERRICFEQDHNWNPCVLNNGRVIYTRWEYTDTPHYFDRLLFHMNPDGTEQMEFYGSNSYWPNAMYWPRPIPGHPSRIVCIVSGHHGVARVGELLILDPALGRHEADGAVQRIPGRGKTVEPVIKDGLIKEVWPRFAMPYPLAEPGTHRGAGKYFLVTAKMDPWAPWNLYLVDVFDNMTLFLPGGYSMATPFRPRPRPTVIPSKVHPNRKDGTVYMVSVYEGEGLKGYPRGSIKALRVGTHHYRYGGNGDTRASSYEGGWDVKRILGTVPVHPDGSAYFRVPANTPVFIQPLDAEGRAQQLMRSWFTAMPGEVLSCVGCHERQNTVPPNANAMALQGPVAEIEPWFGPERGFSFDREVQPVLDRRCAGCHDGQPRKDGKRLPDFRAKRLHKDFKGSYSPAYLNLARYVRRAGYESDYHLPSPAEFEATTSHLVQMLLKGHHNVRLTRDEWRRIYAWIDFNVPYPANWRESHRPPEDEQVERRAKYLKLHANIDDHNEDPLPLPPIAKFEPPAPEAPRPAPAKLEGWPLAPEAAAALQRAAGLPPLSLDLGDGLAMAFAPVPAGKFVMGDAAGFPDEFPEAVVAIEKPFYIATHEVTNAQFARFDPDHESAYIDARGKDRFTRGYPVDAPDQPVIRVSWHRAMAFCRWLSHKTGQTCTLPTEAQWEWACRAGTASPWHFGEKQNTVANFSDSSLSGWNWGRVEPGYSDGVQFSAAVGSFKPNAWGVHDMHGNLAEWTLTAYRPYPYVGTDGRNDPATREARVVRGGSWNDLLRFGRSASRWRYPPHQPVYNVGLRIVVLPGPKVARR